MRITESDNPRSALFGALSRLGAALPVLTMLAIFYLSNQPHLPDFDGQRDLQSVAGHFGAYALLGASLAHFLLSRGRSALVALSFAIGLATFYGVLDELHQAFVPNRHADPADVLVDFLGAVVGALLVWYLTRRLLAAQFALASSTSDADPDRLVDGSSARIPPARSTSTGTAAPATDQATRRYP